MTEYKTSLSVSFSIICASLPILPVLGMEIPGSFAIEEFFIMLFIIIMQ